MSDTPGWEFENPDDELLAITQCICGARFARWTVTISVHVDDTDPMPCCGRRVYFKQAIEIVEVQS